MERMEFRRCYILQKDVCLFSEVSRVYRGDRIVISGERKRCGEVNNCGFLKKPCRWVSPDFNFDGLDKKKLPPPETPSQQ